MKVSTPKPTTFAPPKSSQYTLFPPPQKNSQERINLLQFRERIDRTPENVSGLSRIPRRVFRHSPGKLQQNRRREGCENPARRRVNELARESDAFVKVGRSLATKFRRGTSRSFTSGGAFPRAISPGVPRHVNPLTAPPSSALERLASTVALGRS